MAWEGPEEADSTWEPVSCVYHDAPAVLRKELTALWLKAEQKRAIVEQYGPVSYTHLTLPTTPYV